MAANRALARGVNETFALREMPGANHTARMTPLSRRHFLASSSLALIAGSLARAAEPFARTGAPRLRLSLAAYSFRDYFTEGAKGKENVPAEHALTMEKFIDRCAEWQCDGAELTSYWFPKEVTDERLIAIRRQAHLRGVSISGTAVGNTFTHPPGADRDKQVADVKQWIDRAALLGAPHIRVFAGAMPKGGTLEAATKACIEQLEECGAYAGKHGIFLGVENHGGIVAEPEHILEIIRAVKSPWVGINLDTGNFQTDDPYADLAKIAPYAVNVQIKSEIKRRGAKEPEKADFAKLAGILRAANYQGWVALEFEEKTNPWERVPVLLAELRAALSAPAKAAVPAVEWTPLFDGKTLGKWKETDFAGHADVAVKNGEIQLPQGGDMTGINLEAAPAKMDYEVEFQAKRVEGDDFFGALTLPVGEKHVTFIAGGWGGSVVGISNVNGENASENETTTYRNFKKDQWYRIRVRVTKAKVEAWIDAEQVVDLETEGKNLEIRIGEIESSKPFGIATWRTSGVLKDIRWRKL
jgi:sugar phosphate isomerase/epimerase